MPGSVNKVILVGNLGKDPETRSFQNGGKVTTFSIATFESWNDRNSGERQERTQWHQIAVFNEALGEICQAHLRKGSKVYLEGSLETRSYDKDGQKQYVTEIVLRPFRGEMTMLDSKARRRTHPAPGAAPAARRPDETGPPVKRREPHPAPLIHPVVAGILGLVFMAGSVLWLIDNDYQNARIAILTDDNRQLNDMLNWYEARWTDRPPLDFVMAFPW